MNYRGFITYYRAWVRPKYSHTLEYIDFQLFDIDLNQYIPCRVRDRSIDNFPYKINQSIMVHGYYDENSNNPNVFVVKDIEPIQNINYIQPTNMIFSILDMKSYFEKEISTLRPIHREITRFILNQCGDAFYLASASFSHHHSYIGGLAVHVREVLEVLKGYISVYNPDKSLSISAGIIHDAGKTEPFFNLDYYNMMRSGKYISHEDWAIYRVNQAAYYLNIDPVSEEVDLLKRSVKIHKPYWNITREGLILQHIDSSSARIQQQENNGLIQTIINAINGSNRRLISY